MVPKVQKLKVNFLKVFEAAYVNLDLISDMIKKNFQAENKGPGGPGTGDRGPGRLPAPWSSIPLKIGNRSRPLVPLKTAGIYTP